MLRVYTSYNCSSCKKATKWLEENGFVYEQVNFFSRGLLESDVQFILKYARNGFEDVISERSKIYGKYKESVCQMTTKDLIQFIIDNPSILKRPIIVDDVCETMITGFNENSMEDLL